MYENNISFFLTFIKKHWVHIESNGKDGNGWEQDFLWVFVVLWGDFGGFLFRFAVLGIKLRVSYVPSKVLLKLQFLKYKPFQKKKNKRCWLCQILAINFLSPNYLSYCKQLFHRCSHDELASAISIPIWSLKITENVYAVLLGKKD